tara:strand:- start:482 stop:736 length:255 start_codon:yes stop_codon:yes gene_type:complete
MDESIIYKKLYKKFHPSYLKVVNESDKHLNHPGSPGTKDSHFYVEIKSKELSEVSRVEGQRKIFAVLDKEIKETIHALSIKIID